MKTNGDGDLEWTQTLPTLPGIIPIGDQRIRMVSDQEYTVLCPLAQDKIWLLKFSEIITDVKARPGREITQSYNLHQNYPNPFNPSTTIEFDLPKTSEVTLKVYNIVGEEVATLLSASLPSGPHSVEWDAGELATGAYLYRLQAGEYVQTRKMMLMK
jgi:hypothetical protein